jgi:beta-xylosidase
VEPTQQILKQIDIERTEIVGISTKTLRSVALWGFSSMTTFVGAAIWITATLKDIQSNQERINSVNELRLQTLEVRIEKLETEVKQLSRRSPASTSVPLFDHN